MILQGNRDKYPRLFEGFRPQGGRPDYGAGTAGTDAEGGTADFRGIGRPAIDPTSVTSFYKKYIFS